MNSKRRFTCRFCLSPADKVVSLENFGIDRLKSWMMRNIGIEIRFNIGFSNHICWACVTTFQGWAAMLKARADCSGVKQLSTQSSWWEQFSSSECIADYESPSETPPLALICLPPPVPKEVDDCAPDHPPLPKVRKCSVALRRLHPNFIKKSCRGELDLQTLPADIIKPKEEQHLSCSLCNVIVGRIQTMKEHAAEFHPLCKICPYCAEMFDGSVDINDHLRASSCRRPGDRERLLFVCPRCPATEPDFAHLADHFRSVHHGNLEDWPRPCWHCDRVYLAETQLLQHVRGRHDRAKRCQLCRGQFASRIAVATHVLKHHSGVKFPQCFEVGQDQGLHCLACEFKPRNKADAVRHFASCHPALVPILESQEVTPKLARQCQQNRKRKYPPVVKSEDDDNEVEVTIELVDTSAPPPSGENQDNQLSPQLVVKILNPELQSSGKQNPCFQVLRNDFSVLQNLCRTPTFSGFSNGTPVAVETHKEMDQSVKFCPHCLMNVRGDDFCQHIKSKHSNRPDVVNMIASIGLQRAAVEIAQQGRLALLEKLAQVGIVATLNSIAST